MKRYMNTASVKKKKRTAVTAVLLTVWIGLTLSGCAGDKDPDRDRNTSAAESGTGSETAADYGNAGQVIDGIDDEQTVDTAGTQDSAAETTGQQDTTADTGSLYEQFLKNEVSAVAAMEDPNEEFRVPFLEKGSSCTFEQLGQRISEYFLDPEYSNRTDYQYAQYAYVNSPDSEGSRKLLLKFVGLNLYTQDDDSYAVVVISEDNGQLYVTAEYECWARSATIAYGNGTLSDDGSGGAGDHYSGISVLLSDGTITSVYGVETLYGWWASYISDTVYNEVFGADTEPGELIVSVYTIGNDRYYQYETGEVTEEQKTLCETYISRCRDEQGIHWSSDEEVHNAINARCTALGISSEIITQQPELAWITLE